MEVRRASNFQARGRCPVTRPLEWQKAIRDHPQRPSADQCHVLDRLSLRLGWSTGRGFASLDQLMADAAASKSTVQRALSWARGEPKDQAFFLTQTKRG